MPMKKDKKIIYLASDHAGFELKEKIKRYFNKNNIKYNDLGLHSYNSKDDYPDYIIPAARKVSQDKNSLGIIVGGSGQGEAIAANKVKGIRAAVLYSYNENIVKLSREHNNSNVLSLGARFLNKKEAIKAVSLWLKTSFSEEERHKRRLKKIEDFENKTKFPKIKPFKWGKKTKNTSNEINKILYIK